MTNYAVILDACVLYPAPIRSYLLYLAQTGLKNDRHVVAAAIRGQAEAIITYNLKDFPDEALAQFGISAIHPDEFLSDMFELNPGLAIQAAHRHRKSLKSPPFSTDDYLDCLQKQKLPSFVSLLKNLKFAI